MPVSLLIGRRVGPTAAPVPVSNRPVPRSDQPRPGGADLLGEDAEPRVDRRGVPGADLARQPGVLDDRVGDDAGAPLVLAEQPHRGALVLGQRGVDLPVVGGRDELVEDEGDRDHRDDHDHHEEQPQAVAEARSEDGAGSHELRRRSI